MISSGTPKFDGFIIWTVYFRKPNKKEQVTIKFWYKFFMLQDRKILNTKALYVLNTISKYK
jgi:hypothetical protein